MPKRKRQSLLDGPLRFGNRSPWMRRLIPAGFTTLFVVATYITYSPALHGGFIFDDDVLLTRNELVKATDGLYRIWFTTEPVDYWPLTNSGFWLQWRLWGMNPAGYHVTNFVLHVASGLLVWMILRRLLIPGSFLAALLFAVHPVNVESVAWIAQQKNTLSMLLFLLAIWSYLNAEAKNWHRQSAGWYCASLLGFVLAMLSKGSVAILPLVLLLIVWWEHKRITRTDLLRITPFMLIAVTLTLVNIWFQHRSTPEAIREAGFPERLADAGVVVWFYLSKAFLPINLSFVYSQPKIDPMSVEAWVPSVATIGAGCLLLCKRQTCWGKPLWFAWAFYCAALLPVIGFTDVGFMKYSLVADHYQYIAILAPTAVAAAAWTVWQKQTKGVLHAAALWSAAGIVAALVWQARQQSQLYAQAITLYEDTLSKNPGCWMAHNNLGNALSKTARLPEAIQQYQEAIRLRPDYAEAHNNLGNALSKTARSQDAIEQYQEALQFNPNYVEAHSNLGNALFQTGQPLEAIEQYQEAIRLKPDLAEAHNNLGFALFKTGRVPEAIEQYQEAIRLKSDYAEPWFNLALANIQLNRSADAILAARKAIDLAKSKGQTTLAEQIETWLTKYRSGQPEAPTRSAIPEMPSQEK